MRVYVYAWVSIMSQAAAIRTESFLIAVVASASAAYFAVETVKEIR